MKNFIRKFLRVGLKPGLTFQLSRTIILTNAIALIAITLCCILLPYLLNANDWKWTLRTEMTLATIVILFFILVFNKLHQFDISRFLLSILIPVMSSLIAMLPRISDPSHYHYIPRSPGLFCIVLATSVVPLMVFSTRELKFMVAALGINVLILGLIDPSLYIFSADYKESEYTLGRFVSNNIILFLALFFLIGCTVFLKTLFEFFEKQNESLIHNLNEKNEELKNRNEELFELYQSIEAQNTEIQAQSEEIIQSQENLFAAHHEIELQKEELEKKNVLLEESLDAKSKDLLNTNQQLVIQNHELQQFSYTISHNLRGPLASMLGLINIYHLSTDVTDKASIFSLLEKSVLSLETVVLDLNKIIDFRRDKFNITEKVKLEAEVNLIIQSLNVFIKENEVSLNVNLQAKEIVSIKAYINSILYNLISNAIQYRSPDRKLKIEISSYRNVDYVVIEVADNGLGIDLDRFRGDLFKLYKRFHNHIEGKGLGLYIVKQQVEKLNGRIEVESRLDRGTRFSVFLNESLGQ